MKSFSQFLSEAYLSEEIPVGMSRDQFNALPAETRRRLTGNPNAPTFTNAGDTQNPNYLTVNRARRVVRSTSVSGQDIRGVDPPPTTPTSTPGAQLRSDAETVAQQARARANQPGAQLRSTAERVAQQARQRQATSSSTARNVLSTASNANTAAGAGSKLVRSTGRLGAAKNIIGKAAAPVSAALDVGLETMAQKERGRRTGSALAMGGTKAAGGLAGAAAGSQAGAALGAGVGALFGGVGAVPGAAIGGALGGIGGYIGGSELAGAASETVAGATGKEKKAMALANRQRQAGSEVKGIGGKTTFSQSKPGGPAFMSTGVGSQRKTVQLANTGVVQRGGQSVAGYRAMRDGKVVYKAGPSAQSLARTSSNPLERIGRSLFAGAYKKHDAAKAQQALQKARQADTTRNKKLGVKLKPGG